MGAWWKELIPSRVFMYSLEIFKDMFWESSYVEETCVKIPLTSGLWKNARGSIAVQIGP